MRSTTNKILSVLIILSLLFGIGAVTTDGNIVSTTSASGTKTINMSAFWHY